jgi:hypothetical protein
MVAAATGMPEFFFGDANVGNHATAKTLDRPTELKFLDRQTLWADIHQDILQYVIDQSALAESLWKAANADTDLAGLLDAAPEGRDGG